MRISKIGILFFFLGWYSYLLCLFKIFQTSQKVEKISEMNSSVSPLSCNKYPDFFLICSIICFYFYFFFFLKYYKANSRHHVFHGQIASALLFLKNLDILYISPFLYLKQNWQLFFVSPNVQFILKFPW